MRILNYTFLNNSVEDYLIAGILIAGGFGIAKLVKKLSDGALARWAEKTENKVDDIVLKLIQWPLYWLIVIFGVYTALISLKIPDWSSALVRGLMVLSASLVVALTISKFIDITFNTYIASFAERTDNRLDDQIVPVLRRGFKFILWLMTILLVVDNFGYDVTALITGLGLGGLALAMAAKDTLTNVLGGLTIFIDQPFRINDVVTMMGTTGTVEEVGLRTTRVRTFEGHLVSIPNAAAATSKVENISERPKIRVRFNLGLHYDTPISKCREAVDLIVSAVKAFDRVLDEPSVYFLEFGDSSLGFQVTYYLDAAASAFEAKHAINMSIKQALGAADIEFAFPTVTIDAPPELLTPRA